MAIQKFKLVLSLTPQDAADFKAIHENERFKVDILRKAVKYTKFVMWLIKTNPKLFTQLWGEYISSSTPQQPNQPQQVQPSPQQPQSQPTQNEVKPNA